MLLLRQAGRPSWQTTWAEDPMIFLPRAVRDPWGSLLHTYAGYVQMLPQLIADVVARFPLPDAAAGFAAAGAVAASGCALFVFHASAGHVRQPGLRAVLAASVVLLPTAVLEVTGNGVDAPWYFMYALFWALLWRPAGRGGAAAAALVAFLAMASNILNLLYLPLVAARALALPRWREHAVTAGWLAGLAVQVPAAAAPGQLGQLATPAAAAGFYAQHVLVAALAGWRLASRLTAAAGPGGAVLLAGSLLLAAAAWAFAQGGRRVRLFVTAALLTGLVFTVFPAMVRYQVTLPASPRVSGVWVPGSRYTVCAILLIDASAIVAVDACLRRPSRSGARLPRALAVLILAAGIGTGWVTSFRYPNTRSTVPPWAQTVQQFGRRCRHRPPDALTDLFPLASPQDRAPVPCAEAGPGPSRRPG